MQERLVVTWWANGVFKERGFRGADREERAKALAIKLLADPEVDDDGPRRIDAIQVLACSTRGEDTVYGAFLFDDVALNGWKYSPMDG